MKKFFILFAVIALIAGLSANAMAEADIYASMRFATVWDSYSQERTDLGTDDDSDLDWGLQGNSRMGATFSAGDIGGRYEVGLRGANDSTANGVYTRRLFGTWNFGAGELLIGQEYTPFFKPYGNECCDDDFAILSHGELYDGRQPMIQLKWDTLKLAFITPNSSGTSYIATENNDTTIPKIAASYSIPMDMMTLDLFGGYNTYELANEDIDSYALGAGVKANFDPAYVNLKVWMAQNAANYGLATDSAFDGYDAVNDEDAETMAGLLVVGMRANEKVVIEGGVGYQKSERFMSEEDSVIMYYANSKIDIAKNFFILPEIAYFDYDDSTNVAGVETDMGDRTVLSIKWQIDL